jgi:putative sterol carrier protein
MENIAGSFAALEANFLPDKAANVDKTIQFDFSGREAGTWNMVVRNGTLEYGEGPAASPNATIAVDSDDWLKVLRGELNAVTAFMGGKLKVTPASAAMDLMQFQNWFARQ